MKLTKHEPKICVIGGGTGLSVLLRGLKKYTSALTAIVSVTDDGGSSGKLREELGVLPPGDIRSCLVALSEEENLMSKLFQYRFSSKGSLSGHSFGNLFITALSAISGGFDHGIERVGEVLAIHGRVLPVTLKSVTLTATLNNGKVIRGESNISHIDSPIKKLEINPSPPPAAPQVLQAIMDSDCIVMGPGSLYTSIIANLLVKGVVVALKKSKAKKIYVCNVMTQSNETKGYTLSDHIDAFKNHIGDGIFDYVIVNTGSIPKKVAHRYSLQNSYPVLPDAKCMGSMKMIKADLVSKKEYARHDPDKLSNVIIKLMKTKKKGR